MNKQKERIIKKLKNNINNIYDSVSLNKVVKEIQEILKIPDNFFSNHAEDELIMQEHDIHSLFGMLLANWIEEIIEKGDNKKIIVKDIKRYRMKYGMENSKDNAEGIIFGFAIDLLIDDIPFYHKNININPFLWGSVLGAKVFTISREKVFDCIDSLLEAYLPNITDKLQININELTTIDDLKYIWKEIKLKQKQFQTKYNLKSSKREYSNYDRDKRAYTLKNQGFTYSQINQKLKEEGFESYGYDYIGKILKSYKKFRGEI